MIGDGVHHDAEGQDVTAHDEDAEDELAATEKFAAEAAQQNLTGVAQVLDMGVALTHQPDVVSSVGCQDTEANDQNDTTGGRRG